MAITAWPQKLQRSKREKRPIALRRASPKKVGVNRASKPSLPATKSKKKRGNRDTDKSPSSSDSHDSPPVNPKKRKRVNPISSSSESSHSPVISRDRSNGDGSGPSSSDNTNHSYVFPIRTGVRGRTYVSSERPTTSSSIDQPQITPQAEEYVNSILKALPKKKKNND